MLQLGNTPILEFVPQIPRGQPDDDPDAGQDDDGASVRVNKSHVLSIAQGVK